MAESVPGPSNRWRRWKTFNLRTLLITVSMLALCLGYVANRAQRQRRAVEALRKIDADFCYSDELAEYSPGVYNYDIFHQDVTGRNWEKRRAPVSAASLWLESLIGEDYFRTVIAVDASDATGTRLTPADVPLLSQLPRLKRLEIDYVEDLSDEDLVHLKGLTSLERLFLEDTQVSDAGLVHLSGLRNLKYLSLDKTMVTGPGLAHLKELPNLANLYLCYTEVTDEGLEGIRGWTANTTIYLHGTEVSEAGFRKLQASLPNCTITIKRPVEFSMDGDDGNEN